MGLSKPKKITSATLGLEAKIAHTIRKCVFPMWDSKPKKIASATLGLEAKIAPTVIIQIKILHN